MTTNETPDALEGKETKLRKVVVVRRGGIMEDGQTHARHEYHVEDANVEDIIVTRNEVHIVKDGRDEMLTYMREQVDKIVHDLVDVEEDDGDE